MICKQIHILIVIIIYVKISQSFCLRRALRSHSVPLSVATGGEVLSGDAGGARLGLTLTGRCTPGRARVRAGALVSQGAPPIPFSILLRWVCTQVSCFSGALSPLRKGCDGSEPAALFKWLVHRLTGDDQFL